MAHAPGAPRVVRAKAMGPMNRLIGSRGIDGDGAEFEVEHAGPFLLCDYVCMEGVELRKPPFCAHPHAGVAVASVLCEGLPLRAWDNARGFEPRKLRAGGVYVVCTGRGCVHDEGNEPVCLDAPASAPFGFPGGDRPPRNVRFFQIFFDAGHIHAAEAPQASSTVVTPEEVPTTAAGAMRLRVLLGEYGACRGVAVPATLLHGAVLPFEGQGLLRVPAGVEGFLFAMGRGARVALLGEERHVQQHEELLLPLRSEAYDLVVEPALEGLGEEGPEAARADEALEVLVGFGPPCDGPFYKLLGYGGAVVASSEERARALMREYERDPRGFGLADGTPPADSSRFGLQHGYKDPADGRGECQRSDPEAAAPEARFYELEKGPYQPKGKGKGQ